MLYAFFAINITILVRVVFIRVGIDDILPMRLTAYTALAVTIGCALALIAFDR